METYNLKPISVKAIKWDGENETYEKLMASEIAGQVKSYEQPSKTLVMLSNKDKRGVIVKLGYWIVVYNDGSHAFFDDANFNASFDTSTIEAETTTIPGSSTTTSSEIPTI